MHERAVSLDFSWIVDPAVPDAPERRYRLRPWTPPRARRRIRPLPGLFPAHGMVHLLTVSSLRASIPPNCASTPASDDAASDDAAPRIDAPRPRAAPRLAASDDAASDDAAPRASTRHAPDCALRLTASDDAAPRASTRHAYELRLRDARIDAPRPELRPLASAWMRAGVLTRAGVWTRLSGASGRAPCCRPVATRSDLLVPSKVVECRTMESETAGNPAKTRATR